MATIHLDGLRKKGIRFGVLAVFSVMCAGAPLSAALAASSSWSGASAISPIGQPDSRGGSQLNDVAVNASGLTLAAWDQYTYTNGGGATIGAAVQSGGRWGTPFTVSGTTGFSSTPRVAVGADGTMAVSWNYQDPMTLPAPQQKVQVAVKAAGATAWTTTTLAQGPVGGVAITQFVPVAVDVNGNVTAVWSRWDASVSKHIIESAVMPKGGSWGVPTVLNSTVDGIFPSLSVNANGDAGIAFAVSPYTPTTDSCGAGLQGTCVLYAFRSGAAGNWGMTRTITEALPNYVGYVTQPHVALDAKGLATVVYMANAFQGVRQIVPITMSNPDGFWTAPAVIIKSPVAGASYMSMDLAIDANGNALTALSIFDPTPGVDRASVWVSWADAAGVWMPAERLTDPTVPVDAYATQVAMSPDGRLAFVGWIDHYHGVAQVSKWTGTVWDKATTIGKYTAFASFQEVMGLDVADSNRARAIWKSSAKSGIRIYASSYNQ